MNIDDAPSKLEAFLEVHYPKEIKSTSIPLRNEKEIHIFTSETAPGEYETLLFPRFKADHERWEDDPEHPLYLMGNRFYDYQLYEAKRYHKAWEDYFTDNGELPEHHRYY